MFCKVMKTIKATSRKGYRTLNEGEIIEVVSGWSFMKCILSDRTLVNISEKDFRNKCEEYAFIDEKEFQL